MTQPALAKQQSGGFNSPRIYSWPPQPPHEFEVISVTSAIGAGYPKPFLVGWAAKMAAQCAVDDFDIIGAMLAKGKESAALAHLKGARYRDMQAKADRGTIVHSAVDSYLSGNPFTREQMEERLQEARVPPEMWKSTAGMTAGVMEFLFDNEPEVLHKEATVFSRTHQYAGTLDILGRLRMGGEPSLAIIDFKTSKAIYDDVALQLSAYANADFIGLNDGTEIPIMERPIQHGVVVRPTATGKYEAAAFTLSPALFETFLGVLAVAKGLNVITSSRRPTF